MAALAPRPGRSRAASAPAGKGSQLSRCRGIEESLVRNMQQLNEHRQALTLIRQKRKEQQEADVRQLRVDVQQALQIDFREPAGGLGSPADTQKRCKGALHRLAKIEDNAHQNRAVLHEHRAFLNSVHAMRGSRPPSAPLGESHSRAVEEGARWMGPAMQAAAFHKARAAGRGSPRPSSAPGGASQRRFSAAPSPAPSAAESTAAGCARPCSRSSGLTLRTATPEPMGAQQPEAAPSSGLYSWANSRPPSAGSLRARMRAMEDAVKKNHDKLQTNRKDLDFVVKARKERAELAVQDVLQSIKGALQCPAGSTIQQRPAPSHPFAHPTE